MAIREHVLIARRRDENSKKHMLMVAVGVDAQNRMNNPLTWWKTETGGPWIENGAEGRSRKNPMDWSKVRDVTVETTVSAEGQANRWTSVDLTAAYVTDAREIKDVRQQPGGVTEDRLDQDPYQVGDARLKWVTLEEVLSHKSWVDKHQKNRLKWAVYQSVRRLLKIRHHSVTKRDRQVLKTQVEEVMHSEATVTEDLGTGIVECDITLPPNTISSVPTIFVDENWKPRALPRAEDAEKRKSEWKHLLKADLETMGTLAILVPHGAAEQGSLRIHAHVTNNTHRHIRLKKGTVLYGVEGLQYQPKEEKELYLRSEWIAKLEQQGVGVSKFEPISSHEADVLAWKDKKVLCTESGCLGDAVMQERARTRIERLQPDELAML